jgi:hypothetical protein
MPTYSADIQNKKLAIAVASNEEIIFIDRSKLNELWESLSNGESHYVSIHMYKHDATSYLDSIVFELSIEYKLGKYFSTLSSIEATSKKNIIDTALEKQAAFIGKQVILSLEDAFEISIDSIVLQFSQDSYRKLWLLHTPKLVMSKDWHEKVILLVD